MDKFFIADHWTELTLEEAALWNSISPNFSPKELASNGDGSLKISKEALKRLQALRTNYGAPLIINSGYRDFAYNRRIGGARNSQHVKGVAFDIRIDNRHMGLKLEEVAVEVGFTAIGRYPSFIHVDARPPKPNGGGYRWGSWGL